MFRILLLALFAFINISTLLGQNNWTTPILIGGDYGSSRPIIEDVNGMPVIVHLSNQLNILFVRALDDCGDTWDAPINVSSSYISGIYALGDPDMSIVNGNPAVAFHDYTNANLIFCRADDVNGTSWTQFKIIDSGATVGKTVKIATVNGHPALFYSTQDPNHGSCTGNVKYVRATDPTGANWGASQIIIDNQCNYWGPNKFYFEILNGHPSLASTVNDLNPFGTPRYGSFARANDVDGTSWPSFISVVNSGDLAGYTIVDNKPCLLMRNNDSLGIATALDVNGTSWSGNLDMIDLGNFDVLPYGMDINQFNNTVYVTATNQASPDSLVYAQSPAVLPLNFGNKELVSETSVFFSESRLGEVCGEVAVVYETTNYYFTRTFTPISYYQDFDQDGFGNPAVSMISSNPIAGYVIDNTDCDDADANITAPGTSCDDGISCTIGTTLKVDCSCGNATTVNSIENIFVGNNDLWMDPQNWSLNEIPDVCHDITIPAGKSVKIYNGETGICYTLNVLNSADLLVEPGAQFSAVVSE